ncbi:MAG TPA: AAA family ATPase [Candidatus Saccharimonadales bacterium]|jgi:adenylate kinase family enzyme
MDTKLILLRGPSGAGKSTIARLLQKDSPRSILLIEQDYYRNTVLGGKPDEKSLVPEMVYENALTILSAGYDVIIEGIFRKQKYLPMFEQLMDNHAGENYMFYFDISFEETVRRHSTRSKATQFGRDEMQDWYDLAEPLSTKNEYIIKEASSLTESTKFIKKIALI